MGSPTSLSMAARAGAAALLSALASTSLGIEFASTNGPFNFSPFSSSSSSLAPSPPTNVPLPVSQIPANLPAVEPSSAQPQKDNSKTECTGFNCKPLEEGVEALKKITKSGYDKQMLDITKKQEETKQKEMELKVEECKKMLVEAEIEKQRVTYDEQNTSLS